MKTINIGTTLKFWKLLAAGMLATSFGLVNAAVIELDNTRPYGNTGAPVVVPSNISINGGKVYETRFEPDEFIGDVVARNISKSGDITNPDVTSDIDGDDIEEVTTDNAIWRAHEQLPAHGDRKIFTANKPFRWASLTALQKALLDSTSGNGAGSSGDKLVNWLRGDITNEKGQPAGGNLRPRTTDDHMGDSTDPSDDVHYPLGDMTRSSLQFIGPPTGLIPDPDYPAFRIEHKARTPVLVVGANDGMVHFFRASDGKEVVAYVPEGLLANLKHLSDVNYNQEYFVDGTPTVGDAKADFPECVSNPCWRTVLLGGLGSGGRLIYALDVTDPVPSSESVAADDMFLWEFEHADLGFSFSRPIIAKLFDGTWVAIFGNGIHDSGTKKASLFVVNIDDGTLIKKIEVTPPSTVAPNGLQSPTALDIDFDGDVDFVYAGDTEGNMWKFDFTNADGDGDPDPIVSYSGGPLAKVTGTDSDGNSTTLIIQTAPIVTTTNEGEIIVVFGTGKIFGSTDATTDYGDGLFGILDNAGSTGHGVYPADFSLDVYPLITSVNGSLRTIGTPTTPSGSVGWHLDLDTGERVLNQLTLTNRRVTFTTVNPLVEGNDNWISGVDYESGGTPEQFLDIDGDGDVDGDDLEGTSIPVSLYLADGVVSSVRVANIENGLDVNLVSQGLRRGDFVSPFSDPGLLGGHFDLDTFNAVDTETCFTETDNKGKTKNQKCHTHEYDDEWDVNGVNMLVQGLGIVSDPPNVESADGILSSKHKSFVESMEIHGITNGTSVYIEIINPWSADTPALAQERASQGIDDNAVAPHPTFFFQCGSGGTFYELPAPAFNTNAVTSGFVGGLSLSQRTCNVGSITEMRIKFDDINSLRATEPKCVKDNKTGPILGDPLVGQNTTYRDGAIVVQVRRSSNNEVIYENANYEHLQEGALLNDNIPDGVSHSVECEVVNERLRAYKDPEQFGGNPPPPGDGGDGGSGSDGGSGGDGGGTETTPLGEIITTETTVVATQVLSARVSWREVIEE